MSRVIDHDVLERMLGAALRSGGEFAEVYAEDKRSTSVGLDDGRVEQVTSGRDRGAGIRVIAGETTGFAHTSDLSEAGLAAAAEAAAAAASRGGGGAAHGGAHRQRRRRIVNADRRYPDDVAKTAKVELLQRIDDAARSRRAGDRPGVGRLRRQPQAGARRQHRRAARRRRDRPRASLRISVVANGDTGMQTGFQSMGHTIGFEVFDVVDVEELARDAARQAITKLDARPAPSGSMPVVIKHGTGGVLFHEACGHGLEADHVHKGAASTPARSASWSRRRSSPSSTTARWPASGARSRSTTRATPPSATC